MKHRTEEKTEWFLFVKTNSLDILQEEKSHYGAYKGEGFFMYNRVVLAIL